jgi:SAM-dependent methyltransferase
VSDPAQAAYRAFVGPADQYDVIGGAQFALLFALGLREEDRLLDIGCGSLRGGRLFIPYLAPGGYVGVEPEQWLIDAAIDQQLGHDILAIKRPVFDHSDDFSLGHLGQFDYVLAQGIATNTGPLLLQRLLGAIATTLASAGLAAVTVIHPGTGDQDAVAVDFEDQETPAWRYPGCYSYDRSQIASAINDAGLVGQPIQWFHPRHQWWLLARSHDALPPNARFSGRSAEGRLHGTIRQPDPTG